MTQEILLTGTLLLMAVTAVLMVVTDRLFTAVVYSGILSAAAAFCYLLLSAPDVALAEAVIGSTLSTIIYLVTLKKYRIFTIYLSAGRAGGPRLRQVLSLIERALHQQELELHLQDALGTAQELLVRPDCDLLLEQKDGLMIVHGERNSRYLGLIEEELARAGLSKQVRLQDSMGERTAGYKGGDA